MRCFLFSSLLFPSLPIPFLLLSFLPIWSLPSYSLLIHCIARGIIHSDIASSVSTCLIEIRLTSYRPCIRSSDLLETDTLFHAQQVTPPPTLSISLFIHVHLSAPSAFTSLTRTLFGMKCAWTSLLSSSLLYPPVWPLSGGTTPRPSGGHGATSSATVSANANASEAVARPPSSVSDDNPCYQVVRTYVTAKDFYDKIISDKKAKDKKNRRAEQVRV